MNDPPHNQRSYSSVKGGSALLGAPLHSEVAEETTVELVVLDPLPKDELATRESVVHHELHVSSFEVNLPPS